MAEKNTEQVEAPKVDESQLNDLGRMLLNEIKRQTEEYNKRVGLLNAATADKGKAIHDLRENSDDPNVVKFREAYNALMEKAEAMVAKIDGYISENLLAKASLSPEQIEAEKNALKEKRAEVNDVRKAFLALPAVKSIEGVETLLPAIAGSRVSSGAGTGKGGAKPRIAGIEIDGELASHTVEKDGEKVEKSSFTDAARVLSDKHKVKIKIPDLHAAWFDAAKVSAENWSEAPNEVSFVFPVTDKDGKNHNHEITVYMPTE